MKLTLYRLPSTEFGTFGALFHGKTPLCNTLEEPWRENRKNVSCIPAGLYRCVSHNSKRFPNVWRLKDVPNRTGILIHAGNTIEDIEGCILVGKGVGELNHLPALTSSRKALNELRKVLPKSFDLEIINFLQPKEKLSWWQRLFKGV